MPIKTPKWRNMIYLILGFTVIVMVFEISPRVINNIELIFEWVEQSSEIKKSNEIEIQLQDVKRKNHELKGYVNNIVSDYEESRNASSILKMLDEMAVSSKVDIESIKPKAIFQRDNLWLQPIEVELTSQYENYYNFIRFLENSPKVFLVKETFIEPDDFTRGDLLIKLKLEVYLNL